MNNKQRLELAGWAISRAKKEGADQVSVNIGNSRNIEVQHRDGMLDQLQDATENYLSISIYADSRYSNHSTNDLRKESLEPFIREAVAMTKYLDQDQHRSLPDPKYYEGQRQLDLNLFDSGYDSVTSENRVKMAKEIEAIAHSLSDKIITCTAQYGDSIEHLVKVHSNGFEGEKHSTSFGGGLEVTVNDEGGGRPSDWSWCSVRHLKNMKSADKMAKEAVERSLAKVGQAKMESGVYDMIVENRAANRLLYMLYEPMQGHLLYRKNSFLDGKLGEKIGSEKLSIIDDPFIPGGLGSKMFDGDGMATKRRTFIDKGVLKAYFISYYYCRKLDMEPTTGAYSNVIFEYGDKSLDELIKDVKKGILVTSFIGGNSNSTTGDFSYGIIGNYIENGKLIRPVNEMNISGNQVDLWNQLVELGNDPYEYSSMRRPSLYFKDVQFSGI
jgi:PmbA protein